MYIYIHIYLLYMDVCTCIWVHVYIYIYIYIYYNDSNKVFIWLIPYAEPISSGLEDPFSALDEAPSGAEIRV